MKRTKRILLGLACIALLIMSWVAAITAKSDADRQRELIDEAASYISDEIYILAVPLLEEASAYQDDYTLEAETMLKDVYLRLGEKDDFERRYTNLLDKQMARKGAAPEVFLEAATYYLEHGKTNTALSILRDGISETEDENLTRFYEENRYVYSLSRDFYDDAGGIHNGIVQVAKDGLWGLADSGGLQIVPCEYDSISTFDGDRAVVEKEGVVSAVDRGNNRVALLHGEAEKFGNYAENRVGLKMADGWHIATGTFVLGNMVFEEVGMYSNGCAAAKLNGKWGLIKSDGVTWLLEPEYEEVLQDEMGRSYVQDTVFVSREDSVFLLSSDGTEVSGPYEDARPFDNGWAAVKKNGKWGFIDTDGNEVIDFQFDDALSFSGHLAAVKQGDLWGYVSLQGELVIDPQFFEAKSFSDGRAPVRTGLGWQIITLLEYENKGGSLF